MEERDWRGVEISRAPYSLKQHIKDMAAQNLPVDNPFVPPKEGTPINVLPPELLSYVFNIGTDMEAEEEAEEEEEEDEDEMDTESEDGSDDEGHIVHREFQVLVSHVCRHWREVALSTPSLWSDIDFSEGPPFEKSRVWVDRSKGHPLRITMDCTQPEEGDSGESDDDDSFVSQKSLQRVTEEDLSDMLSTVLPHVDRWQSFQIMVSEYAFMHHTLKALSTCPSAPILENLELYHYGEWEQGDEASFQPAELKDAFLLFHGNAPKLIEVALWGVHLDWDASTFLSGLIDLELAYHALDVRPSLATFTRILRDSPHLATLALSGSGPAGEPSDWFPEDRIWEPIPLPSIEALVLAFLEPPSAQALLRYFAFPNLKALTLDFETGDYTALMQQISARQPGSLRSFVSSLEQLKISGIECSRDVINDFYDALANLQSLNLNMIHLDPTFLVKLGHPISELTTSPNSDFSGVIDSGACPPAKLYLPHLTAVSLVGVTPHQAKELIKVRKRVGQPIKSLALDDEVETTTEEEEWFAKNVDEFGFFTPDDDDDEVEIEDEDGIPFGIVVNMDDDEL